MAAVTIPIFLAGIFAPALFWTGYFYYKDRFRPEPLVKFGTAYLLGLAAAGLCLGAYALLPLAGIPEDPSALMEAGGLRSLLYGVGVTGLLEESVKLLPFVLIVARFRSFDERTDGIIYASAVALGFASFENFRFLSVLQGWELYGRAFASPLTHAAFASLWGYPIGLAKLRGRPLAWPLAGGLAAAALAHGLFNFLTISPKLRIGAAFLVLIIWIWLIRKLEKADGSGKGREDVPSPD
jgi:RsiW-degrading membrane proteinase PrsW (M82 family)